MRNSSRAALAIGLGLVGVAGLVGQSIGQERGEVRQASGATAAAPAPAAGKPVVVGTIDMDAVLKNYDKFKVKIEITNAEGLKRHSELMKLVSEGQAEGAKFEKLAPGSLDRQKIEDKLTALKAQIEAGKQQAQAELERREVEMLAEVYNDIKGMSEGVAKQRGINFVVKYSNAPISASDPKTIQATMFQSFVYADPKLDLTADVTRYLNSWYYKNGGVKPKGPEATAGRAGAAGAGAAAPATAEAPTGATPR